MHLIGEADSDLRSNSIAARGACSCTLHDSIADVPASAWNMIVDEQRDLAMDRRLILAQERTLHDQCRTWVAVIRDGGGRPVACACLCLFKVDAVVSAHAALQRIAAFARKGVHRGLLTMNVLFCGLPVPAGESHLRIAPHADVAMVMSCLHDAMATLARRVHAAMIVLKEFDRSHELCTRWLEGRSYIAGDVPPMHRLTGEYDDFDHFLGSMRSRYRAQVLRSLRKIESGGFAIERHRGASAIAAAFTDELHDLYERVWLRSRYKLEHLPRGFFAAAAEAAGDDAWLTIIRGRHHLHAVAGFTFSIERAGVWHNLYSGVDDSINGTGDILFNLFYADLALAFERDCGDIRLGQTADAFKARLGATVEPLRFFIRARSPIVHAAFRMFSAALFPPMAAIPESRVFKDIGAVPVRDEHTSVESDLDAAVALDAV